MKEYHQVMAVVHISEEDAARDFAGVLDQVRAGAEVLIVNDIKPTATIRAAFPVARTLSESILIAQERSRKRGYKVKMDPDFVSDMEEIIANRRPRDVSAWD